MDSEPSFTSEPDAWMRLSPGTLLATTDTTGAVSIYDLAGQKFVTTLVDSDQGVVAFLRGRGRYELFGPFRATCGARSARSRLPPSYAWRARLRPARSRVRSADDDAGVVQREPVVQRSRHLVGAHALDHLDTGVAEHLVACAVHAWVRIADADHHATHPVIDDRNGARGGAAMETDGSSVEYSVADASDTPAATHDRSATILPA